MQDKITTATDALDETSTATLELTDSELEHVAGATGMLKGRDPGWGYGYGYGYGGGWVPGGWVPGGWVPGGYGYGHGWAPGGWGYGYGRPREID